MQDICVDPQIASSASLHTAHAERAVIHRCRPLPAVSGRLHHTPAARAKRLQ